MSPHGVSALLEGSAVDKLNDGTSPNLTCTAPIDTKPRARCSYGPQLSDKLSVSPIRPVCARDTPPPRGAPAVLWLRAELRFQPKCQLAHRHRHIVAMTHQLSIMHR